MIGLGERRNLRHGFGLPHVARANDERTHSQHAESPLGLTRRETVRLTAFLALLALSEVIAYVVSAPLG